MRDETEAAEDRGTKDRGTKNTVNDGDDSWQSSTLATSTEMDQEYARFNSHHLNHW
jgi:hypothetical protein